MADLVLNANKREATGKNKVNKIRQEELIPGVIYAKGEDNLNVQFTAREFDKILRQAGTSTIITLDIDGDKKDVLIKDYQTHPYKNQYLHVDFQAINQNETIRVNVPVILLGRDDLDISDSVLVQNMDNIDVECLPKYIPQTAEVDITDFQIGDNRIVADLDISKNENIIVLAEEDEVVCSLQEVTEEVIPEDEEADAADVPTVDETEESSEESSEE
ncbi:MULTISPECIES: 50S ribosomal protein L25 [Anaerococcus]|uniref:Large ribosomal subunit protein bL25 n=1 Tax=Anaerococcus nagyae TaxID=1755241 RepID=A0A3E2TFP7_9FIRM|nr:MULTISPECIES: 50S ribosomal protein L25 [Anaerococcus]MBP2070252.1 large subunit ribosomal protein L25 [Anaerococcus nagyae]MDU1829295.1 50S ribosomal protein L25 [Anaerococcus sp.]MDU1864064.1 50S ribosomal protein L25 [Anaerococcus sp.]MDU3211817.1 50S ribosomal protein L25 [Anaerococcus sp.]RGB74710.1 50S ribosomal protein L25 [Anaerococcus nagyae]